MATSDYRQELDTMKAELSQLRSSVSEMTQAIKSTGMRGAAQMREAVADELRPAADAVREGGRRAKHEVEDTVSEHPYTTVGTAVGVGFALAKLLERRGRHRH